MKIVSVEPIPVAYPEPNDFDATRYLCLVKITTDDGTVGWGESITQFPEANPAVSALITGLAEYVVGQNPVHTEKIWRDLKNRSWWYGYRILRERYWAKAFSIYWEVRCTKDCLPSLRHMRTMSQYLEWQKRQLNGFPRVCRA